MSFTARTRSVAAQFLQSVVVFDDAPTFGASDVADDDARASEVILEQRGEAERPHELQAPTLEDEPDVEVGVDAKKLSDAFSAEGLICGFIKPKPDEGEAIENLVVRAARRADIVVLDWSINRDQGNATLQIIKKILDADGDEQEERLRLIAIYTSRLETQAILVRIGQLVREYLPNHKYISDEFTIKKGPLRITLYAKASAHVIGHSAAQRACDESELPGRLIEEFAALSTGLVPLVALAGLAAVRSETHRILTVLNSELDPAYIAQRILAEDETETAELLVAMVSSELRAVMEDRRVSGEADSAAILEWLKWRIDAGAKLGIVRGTNDAVADLASLLKLGLSASADAEPEEIMRIRETVNPLLKRKDQVNNATRLFTVDDQTAAIANKRFAMQVTLRTHYKNPPRVLQLGTLVRSEDGCYLVCIQPLCDSVRIANRREFPFVPAEENPERFELVVMDPQDGVSRTLFIQRRPFLIQKIEFEATPGTGCVQAHELDGVFHFLDVAGRKYYWIGRLHEAYGQRVAHALGTAMGRVGVSEFEWLRKRAG
jgi:hypothetical protein